MGKTLSKTNQYEKAANALKTSIPLKIRISAIINPIQTLISCITGNNKIKINFPNTLKDKKDRTRF